MQCNPPFIKIKRIAINQIGINNYWLTINLINAYLYAKSSLCLARHLFEGASYPLSPADAYEWREAQQQ